MLKPLDVIWIYDNLIDPPHPKMVVSVHPAEGLFYRINSRPFLRPCVALIKDPDHLWLDHDSFLHIDPLMLDDYIVEMALKRSGVIGVVATNLSPEIKRLTLGLKYLTLKEKQGICFSLP